MAMQIETAHAGESGPTQTERAPRRARPLTIHFDPCALATKLGDLARLKPQVLGFNFEGSDYESCSRTRAPNADGLEQHADALLRMLELYPTGFPSFSDLRSALLTLQSHFSIYTDCPPAHHYRATTDAADRWRTMLKHV